MRETTGPDAMTEASTIRAVARVNTAPPVEADRPALVPRSRPGYLGAHSVTRLLVIELAVLLPVATLGAPQWSIVTAAAVGLLVAATASSRRKGRWWTERVRMRRRYRHRHAAPPDRSADQRVRALRALAPELSVANAAGVDGAPVGVGADGAGWYAVAALLPTAGMRGDIATEVPLDRLARLITDAGQPGTAIQVVLHTTPTPSPVLDDRQWCAASYRELLGRYGPVPANQTLWIVVRLDACTLAPAAGGRDESDRAHTVVAALIRRISRSLERAGVPTQILDAEGLLDALAYSCDLAPSPERPATPREEWPAWHSAHLAQTCFWLRRWPEPRAVAGVLEAVSTAPTAGFTSVAILLEPGDDGVELRCLTRLAAPPALLEAGCRTLTEAARKAGADLLRLDGEQAPAVYASAPTGGGAC